MAETPDRPVVGRFAPSPTGELHIGSLATAVGSYLMAKQAGGSWLLRFDDLDTQRQVPGMADDIRRTLESFGLLWDSEISCQSRHIQEYQKYFGVLQEAGAVYPCHCSRKEIARSASAPHVEDDCVVYPGTCRAGHRDGAVRSWRVKVPEEEICFTDVRKGHSCQKLPVVSGDFVVKRGDGGFAYQLAVVVDDFLTGVTQVVRGEDLLASTPRQIHLQRQLGFPTPVYCHLPLVTGPNGTKLSKRDALVSFRTGKTTGEKQVLLQAILAFLGQSPPHDLAGLPCCDILDWGITNFSHRTLPARGGPLKV